MAFRFQDIEKWRRPEIYFAELLNGHVRGDFIERGENIKIFHRALVVAVDVIGGMLENETGAGTYSHVINNKEVSINATIGPSNPRNSIKARILSAEFDQFISDDDLRVYWPLFPEHMIVPIKPGEHVYVLFEDRGFEHGLWLGKVSGHENVNFAKGDSFFKSSDTSRLNSKFDGEEEDTTENTDFIASGRLINNSLTKLFSDS